MKMKPLVMLLLLLLLSVFSCKKSEYDYEEVNIDTKRILKFDNINSLINESNTVNKYSIEQKVEWEKNRHFTSYGVQSDILCNKTDFESFSTVDQFKEFASTYSNFFEISTINGCELQLSPLLINIPYRYLINEEHLVQIGDTVYKVFKNFSVKAHINHLAQIRKITDEQFNQKLQDQSIVFCDLLNGETIFDLKSESSNNEYCGSSLSAFQEYDKNKTIMTITAGAANVTGGSKRYTNFNISAWKKTLGIWWPVNRTISYEIYTGVRYLYWKPPYVPSAGIWTEGTTYAYNSGTLTSSISGTAWGELVPYEIATPPQEVFFGVDCWADTPSTPIVDIECNKSVLYY